MYSLLRKIAFNFTIRELLFGFCMVAVLFWLYAEIRRAREISLCSACSGHLCQLHEALESYRNVKGSYPPLYTTDSNGKPMHSWRVLILPYIGEEQLYAAYKFNEPWDGPSNKKLLDQKPAYYQCPSDSKDHLTPYLAVASTSDKHQMNDSGKNPIHIVELYNRKVNWMQPDDISIDEVNKILKEGNYSQHTIHDGQILVTREEGLYERLMEDK